MQGSRWSISNVKVRAFKSVGKAHLQVELGSGLTCIVGPNGTGKSNFLDAVCFACGYSAAVLGVQRLADLQCTDVQEACLLATHLQQLCSSTESSLEEQDVRPQPVPISPKMTSGLVGLQVCEVSVDIINSIDGHTHTIRCELVPDSGRVYRLDGKLRSGKEVKVSHAQPSHDYHDKLPHNLPTLKQTVGCLMAALQTFLKDRGIDLDQSCCLIRQAHVTRLADNNSKSCYPFCCCPIVHCHAAELHLSSSICI